MIDLRSDNTAAACPEVLDALARVGDGREGSYGDDMMTSRLRDRVREVFEHDGAEVFPLITGTASNALSLSAICPPWGSVLCHESAHIAHHEAGATSHLSGGAVLRTVGGADGMIDPAELERAFAETWWNDPHQSQPSALSLVCPSDLGTVAGLDHTRVLTETARSRGVRCHLDGARMANALATLRCSPADLTWRSGFDIVSVGATKCGGMNADMIVSFDPDVSEELRFRLKRSGHVPSKMRYLSTQLLTLMADDLWVRRSAHANAMAKVLANAFADAGHVALHPVQANLIFIALTDELRATLEEASVSYFELRPDVARFVTSWQTSSQELATLAAALS